MTLPQLQPGDCLLYRGRGFFSWLIRVKTWSAVSHCEGVVSPVEAVAARTHGVRRYPLTGAHLYAILRPLEPFDLKAAMAWFAEHANGQRYDTWGLLRFFLLGGPSLDKQFCSELLTRWYRAGGIHPFADGYDADLTSPGMFLSSPKFIELWRVDPEA